MKLCFIFFLQKSLDNETISILSKWTMKRHYQPFPGGTDIDGEPLFICRTHKFGQIIPGKYSKNIRKCSVSNESKEYQFSHYEILVQSPKKQYEWVKVKKPARTLPQNALFGGNLFPLASNKAAKLVKQRVESKQSIPFDDILSSRLQFAKRKRRLRRSVDDDGWSRNWRRAPPPPTRLPRRQTEQNFTEVSMLDDKCIQKPLLSITGVCVDDPQKYKYFIAKCLLRTGDVTSEQIGKIWWNENNGEWVASFSFGGHEIYCLDYSVLAIKNLI